MKIIINRKDYTGEKRANAYTGGSYHCYTFRPLIIYSTIYTDKDRNADIKETLSETKAQARESIQRKSARQDAKRSYRQPHQKLSPSEPLQATQ